MASPRRPRAQPGMSSSTSDVQVRLPPIKSLQLAQTAPESDRDTVYPTPLSAWPPHSHPHPQQFARTTPLVPTTVDPTVASAVPYPTPISARPHLPHRTSSAYSTGYPNSSSSYTPHTPTAHSISHHNSSFQPSSSFHYVPPTTADSTTSTTSSGRNPPLVDDTRATSFGHDRTGSTVAFAHEARSGGPSGFTQEGKPVFGHDRTLTTGHPNAPERQRYPTHQNQNHDLRYSQPHDQRYPSSQSQESRYNPSQSQDTRYATAQSQDPRYPQPPSDLRYAQSQSQPQPHAHAPDPHYPPTQAQTSPQPRDPSQQQSDDRSVYTPSDARSGGYAPVQSSPDIRSGFTADGRATYAHTPTQDTRYPQDTRGAYTPDPRYAPTQDPRFTSEARYPQDARGVYAPDARSAYAQDPRYPPDTRGYVADQRGFASSQTSPELDARGYTAPAQDTRSLYPTQDTRGAYPQDTRASYSVPTQDARSTYAPQPQPQPQPQTQDSRGYAPPTQAQAQHPQSQTQVQAQDARYTPGHEPRNTFPPPLPPQNQPYVPAQQQPHSPPSLQDTRGYAPQAEQRSYAPSERSAQQHQHQQLPYSHAPPDSKQTQTQGRTGVEIRSSVLEAPLASQSQPREQGQVQVQAQTQARGTTSNEEQHARGVGAEPRVVEVRSGGMQRQSVPVVDARPVGLEAQARPEVLESQARPPVLLEGPARSTVFLSQSQGSQRVVSGAGGDKIGKDDIAREIVQHCTALYKFANHYASIQVSNPHLQPPADELAEMTARAGEVVRLLEALRNDTPILTSSLLTSTSASSTLVSMHSHSLDAVNVMSVVKGVGASMGIGMMEVDTPDRAPKRPWEDVEGMLPLGSTTGSGQTVPLSSGNFPAGSSTPQPSGATAPGNMQQDRTMAEADMELIRTKRALTTLAAAAALGAGGGGTGGGKNKYRKRSRATPPGKCHSCNIRETPEWRRGPDGARTLCNACGLHYAKLVRKREKAIANGETPSIQRIDMEMLRASARAAEGEKVARTTLGGAVSTSSIGTANGGETDDKMNLGIHQGSFQINTDAGEVMPDEDANPQASATFTRPSRPTTSKRSSSTRAMQSPGVPGLHQSISVSSSHHGSGSGSGSHQTPSMPHHPTSTPTMSHHQTPTMPHHPTPHQTAASTSRHPPAAPHPNSPATQPASAQHQPTTTQTQAQTQTQTHHHPPAAQHPSTSTSLHRPGPPPTPPWYLPPHPQPHSMLR